MLIMICDDEPMVRLGLIDMLEELSPSVHEFIEADNGQALVEMASKKADLAIVDIQMPIMDGLDAIEASKEIAPATRWVLLTGHAKFEYAQRAMRLGISDYLLKPVGIEQIKELMTKIGALKDSDQTIRSFLKSVTDHDFDVSSKKHMADGIHEITGAHDGEEPVADLVSKVKAYVLQHYREDIGVNSIADHLNITPNYLSRIFHTQSGIKLSDHLSEVRITKAKELLKNSNIAIKDVSMQVGYYNAKHFAKVFQKIVGVTPSVYQTGVKGTVKGTGV